MKKYLLPEQGNCYKANLHCHTTVSDGRRTPEEVKEIYKAMGYSIVAYTDHDIFVDQDCLTDGDFLALNGFEVEINEGNGKLDPMKKCCHICYIALDKDNKVQPMWNEMYLPRNAPLYMDRVKFDVSEPPYVREYTAEKISEMMQIGRDRGFFVTYNHPTWSRERYPQYTSYNGMHAMEMFNGGSTAMGYEDTNPRVYDDMLTAGKKIYCIGADDNHNGHDQSTRHWDSGVAYTVIKAPALEYNTITDALLKGDFYASEAPEIKALWLDDEKLHIECSEADRILCTFEARRAGVVYSEGGVPVTEADFTVKKEWGYFRITVIDKSGNRACTNAYFPE